MTRELTIGSHFAQLTVLADWVREVAAEWVLPERLTARLDLVLAEAVTNVMEHGYGGAGGTKATVEPRPIAIQCRRQDASLRVEIRDNAPPFDPTATAGPALTANLAEATPSGRGIHLIRHYTSAMTYQRIGGQNRLTLTLPVDGLQEPDF